MGAMVDDPAGNAAEDEKPPVDTDIEEKLKVYLSGMAASQQLEKGKSIVRAAAKEGQISSDHAEAIIRLFENNPGQVVIDLTDDSEDTDHVGCSQPCAAHVDVAVPSDEDDD